MKEFLGKRAHINLLLLWQKAEEKVAGESFYSETEAYPEHDEGGFV
jgi:hypothetical protein